MTSLTDLIYRNEKTHKSFVLKVCKEQLLTVSVVMYFPKNFYLKEAIDKKISELATAGFLDYWIREFVDPRFLDVQHDINGPTNMQIQHLTGIFDVWMIGLAVSMIIFLIEISSSILKKTFKLS